MRTMAAALLLALSDGQASAPARPLEATVPAYPNVSCPVMGKPISSRLWTDTEFGRIWICCKGCDRKIALDVAAAYKTAYPRTKQLENKLCPVSGKPIEGAAATIDLQGHVVRLHRPECVAVARADAQVVLAKAIAPELVEVGNPTCPVSGKPVEKNRFCVIDGRIVRLATAEALDGARKDPKGTLERALDDAKKAAGK